MPLCARLFSGEGWSGIDCSSLEGSSRLVGAQLFSAMLMSNTVTAQYLEIEFGLKSVSCNANIAAKNKA